MNSSGLRFSAWNAAVPICSKASDPRAGKNYIDNPHANYQDFTQADLTQARTALGYEPRFPLEEGVRDYMDWLYGCQAA